MKKLCYALLAILMSAFTWLAIAPAANASVTTPDNSHPYCWTELQVNLTTAVPRERCYATIAYLNDGISYWGLHYVGEIINSNVRPARRLALVVAASGTCNAHPSYSLSQMPTGWNDVDTFLYVGNGPYPWLNSLAYTGGSCTWMRVWRDINFQPYYSWIVGEGSVSSIGVVGTSPSEALSSWWGTDFPLWNSISSLAIG